MDCHGSQKKIIPKHGLIHFVILIRSSTIPAGICAWIGASTWNNAREYRWIELPPNYGEPNTNGELLTNTYNNFWSGIIFSCVTLENGSNCLIIKPLDTFRHLPPLMVGVNARLWRGRSPVRAPPMPSRRYTCRRDTRSPKQGYQWPQKKDLCPPKKILKC